MLSRCGDSQTQDLTLGFREMWKIGRTSERETENRRFFGRKFHCLWRVLKGSTGSLIGGPEDLEVWESKMNGESEDDFYERGWKRWERWRRGLFHEIGI